jgi:hypothetical protein
VPELPAVVQQLKEEAAQPEKKLKHHKSWMFWKSSAPVKN